MPDQKGKKSKKKASSKQPSPSKGKNVKVEKTPKKKADSLTDVQKELFVRQIEELEQKVKSYSNDRNELEKSRDDLQQKYDVLCKDNDDIIHYLKECLAYKETEGVDLQEQIRGLKELHEGEKDKLYAEMSEVKTDMLKVQEDLQLENNRLNLKLATLEEFEFEKEELAKEFNAMEQQLVKQKQEYEEQIYTIEQDSAAYRDRLDKENNKKIEEFTKDLEDKSSAKMNETVKYALKDNVTLVTKLNAVTNHCTSLKGRIVDFEVNEKVLREEISILKQSEHHLTLKNVNNMKMIESLTKNCQEMEDMFDHTEIVKNKNLEYMEEIENFKKEQKTAQQTITALRQNCDQLKLANSALTKQLESQADKIFCLKDIHQQVLASVSELLLISEENPAQRCVIRNLLNHMMFLLTVKCPNIANVHTLHDTDENDNSSRTDFETCNRGKAGSHQDSDFYSHNPSSICNQSTATNAPTIAESPVAEFDVLEKLPKENAVKSLLHEVVTSADQKIDFGP